MQHGAAPIGRRRKESLNTRNSMALNTCIGVTSKTCNRTAPNTCNYPHGDAQRKASPLLGGAPQAPGQWAPCLSFGRTVPGCPRTAPEGRISEAGLARLAHLLEPCCRGRRKHALVRVLLAILHALLRVAVPWRVASLP